MAPSKRDVEVAYKKATGQEGVVAKAPVGRPPYPVTEIPAAYLDKLTLEAKEFTRSPGKLKAWLKQRRYFHMLLQDYLATAPLPGASGVQLNAASSKLFLEMTEGLAAALKQVEEEE